MKTVVGVYDDLFRARDVVYDLMEAGIRADVYAESVRRGSTLLVVNCPDEQVREVTAIIEDHNPIDVEQRGTYWRAYGWTGYDPEVASFTPAETAREREEYAIYSSYEPAFQRHYEEHYAGSGRPYEEYQPAYHAGYTLGVDMRYRTHEWEELEPLARNRWKTEHAGQGAWSDVKEAIRFAWTEVKNAYYGQDRGE